MLDNIRLSYELEGKTLSNVHHYPRQLLVELKGGGYLLLPKASMVYVPDKKLCDNDFEKYVEDFEFMKPPPGLLDGTFSE